MSPLWNWITGIYSGPFQLADHQQLEPDGAAAQDEHVLSSRDSRLLNGLYNGIDGLDESGFFKADIVREGDDAAFCNPWHGFHVLGKPSAIRSETSGKARRFVLLALREKALFAVEASSARSVVEAHDAIAGRPFSNA